MPLPNVDLDVITASIPRFQQISGLSREKINELIADGDLETITISASRLVVVASYKRLLKRRRAKPAVPDAAGATP